MKYIIHRGITSKSIKENTYQSIKKALLYKESLGVETDIRLTKDKIIVLSHNSIINNNYIENMTYKEILKHKYLTTLDKILDINTNKIILLDVKTNNNYKLFSEVLNIYLDNTNKNIYIMSFDKRFIKYFKTKYKKAVISIYPRKYKYNVMVVNYKFTSDKRISNINNKEIFLWTIHNTKELEDVKSKYKYINDYYIIKDMKE